MHSRLAVILVAAGLIAPAGATAYTRPAENRGGHVSTSQVRHDARGLAVKIARHDGAASATVTICRHLRQSAVDCRVRLTFVDPEDGYRSVVRYVVHGIATYGGRWAEIVPAPRYSTGLIVP